MSDFIFNSFRYNLVSTSTVAVTGASTAFTFKAMLVTTGYNDQTSREDQDYVLDPSASSASLAAFELSTGTGYSRQDVTISAKTLSDALNEIHLTGSTRISFTSVSSSGGAIGGMAIFQELAAADSSGRAPVSYLGSGWPVSPNGGDIHVDSSTKGWAVVATTS